MSLIVIENDFGRAVISSHAGATLRSLRVQANNSSYELISGADQDLDIAPTPSGVGSFIMAPWVNRIHEGRLVTSNGEFQLPVDSGVHAIHGTVRQREWQIVSSEQESAEFRVGLESPWPFRGHVVSRIKLNGASLRQTLEIHAADDEEREFPAGVGWHPWFRRSLRSDEVKVQVDAVAQWELDKKVVPSGEMSVTSATEKLREGASLEVGELDGCFQLGETRSAMLLWPELKLTMTNSPEIMQAMIYSPEGSVCVEPQTTTVNAFQLAARGVADTGTRSVSRGNPLVATTVWSWDKP